MSTSQCSEAASFATSVNKFVVKNVVIHGREQLTSSDKKTDAQTETMRSLC